MRLDKGNLIQYLMMMINNEFLKNKKNKNVTDQII